MADDKTVTVPPKPRLQNGETPQSPSFQKRMREWQRARDLAEATRMQQEQNKKEAEKNADRDVLAEVSKGVKEADEANNSKPKGTQSKGSVQAPRNRALRDRRKTLDEEIEAAGG